MQQAGPMRASDTERDEAAERLREAVALFRGAPLADAPLLGQAAMEADRLAGQRAIEVDQLAPPFDLAIGAHPPHLPIDRIVGLAKDAVPAPGRRLKMVRRGGVAERLVRAQLRKVKQDRQAHHRAARTEVSENKAAERSGQEGPSHHLLRGRFAVGRTDRRRGRGP